MSCKIFYLCQAKESVVYRHIVLCPDEVGKYFFKFHQHIDLHTASLCGLAPLHLSYLKTFKNNCKINKATPVYSLCLIA